MGGREELKVSDVEDGKFVDGGEVFADFIFFDVVDACLFVGGDTVHSLFPFAIETVRKYIFYETGMERTGMEKIVFHVQKVEMRKNLRVFFANSIYSDRL